MNQQQQQQPEPLFIIHNTKEITFVSFSNTDNNRLYVATRNGEFYVYDLQTRRPVFKSNILNNTQSLTNICELSESLVFVYCRNGAVIRLTKSDENEWRDECVYHDDNYSFCKMLISKELNLMIVPSKQHPVVDFVDLVTFKKVSSLKPETPKATENYGMLMWMQLVQVSDSSDHHLLLVSYENGDLALFDIVTHTELSRLSLFKGYPLLSFEYSVSTNIGIAGCSELDLQQFTINNNLRLEVINDAISLKNPGLNLIKIRTKDSKIFAVAGWDSRVRVYSVKKARLLCVLDFHKQNVNTIDFSAHDNTLVCGSNDGLISFWNLYSNQ